MTDDLFHTLEKRLAVLDERYDKGWALVREDMAKRETRMLLAVAGMIGLVVAVLGAGLAFLGFVDAALADKRVKDVTQTLRDFVVREMS